MKELLEQRTVDHEVMTSIINPKLAVVEHVLNQAERGERVDLSELNRKIAELRMVTINFFRELGHADVLDDLEHLEHRRSSHGREDIFEEVRELLEKKIPEFSSRLKRLHHP